MHGSNLMAHDHRIQLRWKGQFGANPNAPRGVAKGGQGIEIIKE